MRHNQKAKTIFAHHALIDQDWQQNVCIRIAKDGTIATITSNAEVQADVVVGALIPGMANLHSHAFQRAMAGLAEYASEEDNFWSWRKWMYRFATRITPEQLEIIARYLYIELLSAGYTAIGEFHYLHHQPNGAPYGEMAEMSLAISRAAESAGLRLTHLPVLYQTGGFGGVKAEARQQRFLHSNTDDYLALLEACHEHMQSIENQRVGVCFHSLRAVPKESMETVLHALGNTVLENAPIHIHIAEQQQEVVDCLAWSEQRPVEWLMNHFEVDDRWCLVHATHINREETQKLAYSGAIAGLCPTTEANLGDGIFPAKEVRDLGGAFGIGSDSHVCTNPFAELRMLEYSQRLAQQRRNLLAYPGAPTGQFLYSKCAADGAYALGWNTGRIEEGMAADLVAIDMSHPLMAHRKPKDILGTLIFALESPPIQHVWVGGRIVLINGQHPLREAAATHFAEVMGELRDVE